MPLVNVEVMFLLFKALPRAIIYGKERHGYEREVVVEERDEQT